MIVLEIPEFISWKSGPIGFRVNVLGTCILADRLDSSLRDGVFGCAFLEDGDVTLFKGKTGVVIDPV